MKSVSIKVEGKVQGVWFRKFTKQKADELSVKGFVKNLPDGCVYIEAEGTESAIRQFVAWCHKGSPQAQVLKVTVEDNTINSFSSFEINH